ncbi:hypothetical protein V5F53_14550 [Xanthobacter sp. V4C-4]|uniref:hypothetical protein n=1 Tax=Xanthobacter cornucopiae TaxID=3119924 RepID=UPI00372B07A5
MKFAGLVLAALMALPASAHAQTVSYAEAAGLLAQHCGGDIMSHCRGVNLGSGAIQQCLVAHQAQLSPACAANHDSIRQLTEARAAAQKAVYAACDRDRAEFCAGVVPGDGNLVSCLVEASKVVSQTCTAALTNAGYR